jgi:predicted dehydrogenase
MNRRQMLKSAVAAAGALAVSPGILRAGGRGKPSEKLNVALIGVGGRGMAHYDSLADENVVALCDINEKQFDLALKRFPGAKTYIDWRKCLDHKGLDAVVICTSDHHHAFVSNWALNRNLHVYCEKPLAISVEEARVVRANWLTKRDKLATQVGMQRHAFPNFARVKELVRDGAIGKLESAYAWGDRKIRREKYPDGTGAPPEGFHYDIWLGPSPYHPYSPSYFEHRPGVGACLSWNMYWDFGAGQIGDMGSHTMDLVWNAIDAKLPTTAEGKGEPFNPDVTPVEAEFHFEHPGNDWRGPIKVAWYQGGRMPASPKKYVDLKAIDHGAMFKGSKGHIVCDFTSRLILPFGDSADMTYYKPREAKDLIPPVGHFQKEWINACKNGGKTSCDFGYSSEMIEQMLLGLVAYRVGKKLEYDGVAGRVTNVPEANRYLKREYTQGWTLNG